MIRQACEKWREKGPWISNARCLFNRLYTGIQYAQLPIAFRAVERSARKKQGQVCTCPRRAAREADAIRGGPNYPRAIWGLSGPVGILRVAAGTRAGNTGNIVFPNAASPLRMVYGRPHKLRSVGELRWLRKPNH